MMDIKTYRCNLCCGDARAEDIIGLEWPAPDMIDEMAPHEADYHLCLACIRAIVFLAARPELRRRLGFQA